MEYVNKTVYTKEVYKNVCSYKSFNYELLVMKGGLFALAVTYAARVVQQDNHSFSSWLFVILACIVLPFFLFVWPKIKVNFDYKKSIKVCDGKQLEAIVTFKNSDIVCRNNAGQKAIIDYQMINDIKITKNLVIILVNKNEPLYLNKDGFDADYQEVVDYLYTKCPKIKKPEPKKEDN